MDHIILDFGYDVNVLPNQTWEMMGKPKLTWSHVQMRFGKHQKIIPLGRIVGMNIVLMECTI